MKITYQQLTKMLSKKNIELLFKDGHPCSGINYKIAGFNIEWNASEGVFYLGWTNR